MGRKEIKGVHEDNSFQKVVCKGECRVWYPWEDMELREDCFFFFFFCKIIESWPYLNVDGKELVG